MIMQYYAIFIDLWQRCIYCNKKISPMNKPNERRSGLSPVCQGNLLLQPRWVVGSNYHHKWRLWVLGTLEKNQPQQKSDYQQESSYVATSLGELFALAVSILHLCCKSSLAQAKTFLYTQWYQYKCNLRQLVSRHLRRI